MRAHVVPEDHLAAAVDRGQTQLIVLGALPLQLNALDFLDLEELAPSDAQARYFQGRTDGRRGMAAAVVGSART